MIKEPLSNIEYFAFNLTDATTLKGAESIALDILITRKLGQKVIDLHQIDVNLVVLHPEKDLDKNIDPKEHLFRTCQILAEKLGVRTYYRTTKGKKFRQFTLKQLNEGRTN